jgi:hypothetical protein
VTAADSAPPDPAPEGTPFTVSRCDRCRSYFRVDEKVDRGYESKWWLCPPCHEQLLGARETERPGLEGAPWSSRN